VIPFDIDDYLEIDHECTSPNLMASFLRVEKGDTLDTRAVASSQAFYVIRGSGVTSGEHGSITWSTGDLFVVPVTEGAMQHTCVDGDGNSGAAIYWVHDQPLMDYIGCKPCVKKFEPTLYKKADLLATVEEIKHTPTEDGSERNRLGVLLGNVACPQTKTLTHVLWSLLNSIPAKNVQRPHRHNSVALDLAVAAKPGVYTLNGQGDRHQRRHRGSYSVRLDPGRRVRDAARVVALAPQRERRSRVGFTHAGCRSVHAPADAGYPVRG
jgi:gentisate 1,2-dioxygenase